MPVKNIARLLMMLSLCATLFSCSSEVQSEKTDRQVAVRDVVSHHLMDDHDFTIAPGVTIPLPVILWDGGLKVFLSSQFHHGESVVESGGDFYKLHHGKIYKSDSVGHLEHDEHDHAKGAVLLDFSITKNVVIIILMSALLFFLFKGLAKSYGKGDLPTGAGRFLEPLVVYVRDEIAIPNIGKKHYKRYMNYLLTVFFFIWFLNLAGMMPFGISVTNNIAITFSLALITFLLTNLTANKAYWGHIFWMPGVPKPMRIILAPIELLGIFIKPFALLIRLYANMTAGHIVIMSIIGLIYVFQNAFASGSFLFLTVFLSILELLVAALQAYIFTMLSALYFGAAVEEHDHH